MERDEWNACWRGEDPDHHHKGWDWDVPDELFTAHAPAGPGRALDLACGAGANAIWLAARGWQVTAVDHATAALERARAAAAERDVTLTLVEADVTAFEPEGTFDLVSLCYIHLGPDEQARLLRLATAAVAPGGVLLFIGHDRSDERFREEHDCDDTNLSTPEDVVATIGNDLSVERAEVVEARPHGGEQTARTTLVMARRPP